jgi:DNA-directed RNA polymerase subunit RPC12/RpoP
MADTNEQGLGTFCPHCGKPIIFKPKVTNVDFTWKIEAAAEFPELQPIIVYPPEVPKLSGDITTDILAQYVKQVESWRSKWLSMAGAQP